MVIMESRLTFSSFHYCIDILYKQCLTLLPTLRTDWPFPHPCIPLNGGYLHVGSDPAVKGKLMMQKTGREKIARAISLNRWKDGIGGASSEADLDKGMKSSPIAIGGKAEFIGTDEGRSIYLTNVLLLSFFFRNGIELGDFSLSHRGRVSVNSL